MPIKHRTWHIEAPPKNAARDLKVVASDSPLEACGASPSGWPLTSAHICVQGWGPPRPLLPLPAAPGASPLRPPTWNNPPGHDLHPPEDANPSRRGGSFRFHSSDQSWRFWNTGPLRCRGIERVDPAVLQLELGYWPFTRHILLDEMGRGKGRRKRKEGSGKGRRKAEGKGKKLVGQFYDAKATAACGRWCAPRRDLGSAAAPRGLPRIESCPGMGPEASEKPCPNLGCALWSQVCLLQRPELLSASGLQEAWEDSPEAAPTQPRPAHEQAPPISRPSPEISPFRSFTLRVLSSNYVLSAWKWKSLSRVRLFATLWTVVHGILQARILEWVAFPFSRGSSKPRNRTKVSCIAGRFFTCWATGKAQAKGLMLRLKQWTG